MLPDDRLAIFSKSGRVCVLEPVSSSTAPTRRELSSQSMSYCEEMDSYSPIHDFVVVNEPEVDAHIKLCVACGEGKQTRSKSTWPGSHLDYSMTTTILAFVPCFYQVLRSLGYIGCLFSLASAWAL